MKQTVNPPLPPAPLRNFNRAVLSVWFAESLFFDGRAPQNRRSMARDLRKARRNRSDYTEMMSRAREIAEANPKFYEPRASVAADKGVTR